MSVRKTCEKRGHKFAQMVEMAGSPYVFCMRWLCSGSAVSSFAPPELAVKLHNVIPEEDRFPPVELASDGSVVRAWNGWEERS